MFTCVDALQQLASADPSSSTAVVSMMEKAADRYEKKKTAPVRSMMDLLEDANVQEIDRPRKVRKSSGSHSDKPFHKTNSKSEPKHIAITTRLQDQITVKYVDELTKAKVEYDCLVCEEGFICHLGQFWCGICKGEISMIKGTIQNHCASAKHRRHKATKAGKLKADATLAAHLAVNIEQSQAAGTKTVSMETQTWRVKVMKTFMRMGIPLDKIDDDMRELLEDGPPMGAKLTTPSNLRPAYIPFIHKDELDCVLTEIEKQYISAGFDGASRLGESLVVVLRWCQLHVVSMMRNTWGDKQETALRDYVEAGMMLRYNGKQRRAGH